MPSRPGTKSRLDSWPPTQVRLAPSTPKEYPALEDIDDDPLTYFLTPAPDIEDADGDVDMMDFDAGIESPRHAHEIIRSVSPSSLDGLAKPKTKTRSSSHVPDVSDTVSPDTDEDDEEYIRFTSRGMSLGNWRREGAMDGVTTRSKTRSSTAPAKLGGAPGTRLTAEALLSVSSPSLVGAPSRGRSRASGRGRQQTTPAMRRRGNQAWREPSPDVWSIEEETEEEMLSELGSSVAARSDVGERMSGVDTKAAKPKKRVRFALPAEEM